MPPRRCVARDYYFDMDSDDDSEETLVMRCHSCDAYFDPDDSGTCRECYDEAKETEEALRSQIDELKSKVDFLRLPPPSDPSSRFRPIPATAGDVFLIAVGDRSAPLDARVTAHRAVLVSRSLVFKAMLESDMEESRSGNIKITDVTHNSLRAFVNYLYTAEACLEDQMAFDLLVLAEKYEVMHLKAYCEKFLISSLDMEKALLHYIFARQHNAKKLQEAALAMLTDNMDLLTKSEDYKELCESDSVVVVDIYEAYLVKQLNTAGASFTSGFRIIH